MMRSFARTTRLATVVASLLFVGAVFAGTAGAAGTYANGGSKGSANGECRCPTGLASLEVAASALGLSTAQLQAELKTGKTLAQVAVAQNTPVAALANSIAAGATTTLASAVSKGELTQGQAEAALVSLPWQVSRIISRVRLGALGGNCGLVVLDVSFAAYYLHLTVAQFRAELSTGKTLAQIAAANGRPLDAFGRDAASGVAASVGGTGTLTQAQATELTATVTSQIATAVGGLAP